MNELPDGYEDTRLINEVAVDRWTLLHIASGAGLRVIGVPWWGALFLSVAFEIIENTVQGDIPSVFEGSAEHDSLANSTCDTLALMGGWGVTELLVR